MITDFLIKMSVVDDTSTPVDLTYSVNGFIDNSVDPPVPYDKRITEQALLEVTPNNNSLNIFNSFQESSIGLDNTDNFFAFILNYHIAGRTVVLSQVEDGTIVEIFKGTVTKKEFSGNLLRITLKSIQDVLAVDFPMDTYLGNNSLPAGLEGTADTIKGKQKPRVLGKCLYCTPDLVNSSLQIYQVSSATDCRVIEVFDNGVPLSNFKTTSAHTSGAFTINVASAFTHSSNVLSAGDKVVFSNHDGIYLIATGLVSGAIVLDSGTPLLEDVPTGTPLNVVNFYDNTTDLQYVDYLADGKHLKGDSTILVKNGTSIANNAKVIFGNHLAIYHVTTGVTGNGTITLTNGLKQDLPIDTIVQVVGSIMPVTWGSYNGYFRLSAKPYGTVTCHAVSVDGSDNYHFSGDILNTVVNTTAYTLDGTSKTLLNTVGLSGIYLSDKVTVQDIIDRLMQGCGTYNYFENNSIHVKLIQAPEATPDWTLEDRQIAEFTILANGVGENGVPNYKVRAQYNKIETVQNGITGAVSAKVKQRLAKQFLEKVVKDDTVLDTEPLSLIYDIESCLVYEADITTVLTRLLTFAKERRDITDIVVHVSQVPSLAIGTTGEIIRDDADYTTGRNMLLLGYSSNGNDNTVTLRMVG